jgi:hypothetical protein
MRDYMNGGHLHTSTLSEAGDAPTIPDTWGITVNGSGVGALSGVHAVTAASRAAKVRERITAILAEAT